jgi:hypothetical protein
MDLGHKSTRAIVIGSTPGISAGISFFSWRRRCRHRNLCPNQLKVHRPAGPYQGASG